jgi:hypothetical protein
VVVTLNLSRQYASDRNLRARQGLWRHQVPYSDVVGWVVRQDVQAVIGRDGAFIVYGDLAAFVCR